MSIIVPAAEELIKFYEGYADALPNGDCKAYWDSHGSVWTIGWGTTGKDVVKGLVWSRAQAQDRFDRDVNRFAEGVLRLCPGLWWYPNRWGAVTSFAYNLGLGRLQSSTLRRKINAEDWEGAEREFHKWVNAGGKKLKGLVLRRAAEAKLFSTVDR